MEAVELSADEIFRIRHTFPVVSWSSLSAFWYDKEQWYQVYYKGKKTKSPALTFGKKVADSMGTEKPLAPFTRLAEIEHEFDVMFGKIRVVGSMDSFEPPVKVGARCKAKEYKTGKVPWTQKRANEHGQLVCYALLLWLQMKIRPEDTEWSLEWCPTRETGDFKIDFVHPIRIHTFKVKITMADILRFGSKIKSTHAEMTSYVANHK